VTRVSRKEKAGVEMIKTKILSSNHLELEVGDIVCNHKEIVNDMGTHSKILSKTSICEVVSIDTQQQIVTIKDISAPNECEFTCKNRCDELSSLKAVAAKEKQIVSLHRNMKLFLLLGIVSPFIGMLADRYLNSGRALFFSIIACVVSIKERCDLSTHISLAEKKLYQYLKHKE